MHSSGNSEALILELLRGLVGRLAAQTMVTLARVEWMRSQQGNQVGRDHSQQLRQVVHHQVVDGRRWPLHWRL